MTLFEDLIRQTGKTVYQIAIELTKHPNQIYRWKKSKTLDLDTLKKVCRHFGITELNGTEHGCNVKIEIK